MTVPKAPGRTMANFMDFLARGLGPEACVDARKHTDKQQFGYTDFHEWAEKKAKKHTQHRCPSCGFWVIWKRKAPR